MVTKGWIFNGEEEEENGNVREREKKASEFLGLSEEREYNFLV